MEFWRIGVLPTVALLHHSTIPTLHAITWCLFFVGFVGFSHLSTINSQPPRKCLAWLCSRVLAHGHHPVSENRLHAPRFGAQPAPGTFTGSPSGSSKSEGWSPGKVLPLRLLGVGQTRYYFTTGRKLAAGAGIAPAFAPSKGAVLRLDDPAMGWWSRR